MAAYSVLLTNHGNELNVGAPWERASMYGRTLGVVQCIVDESHMQTSSFHQPHSMTVILKLQLNQQLLVLDTCVYCSIAHAELPASCVFYTHVGLPTAHLAIVLVATH